MYTEFYFEIQYFNSDRRIAITLLHSNRNTQPKTQNRSQKRLFYVHFNNVVLNFTEFKNIVKFMNFTEF